VEVDKMKVVIIGGVAAGPKAASKIIRLMPDADVTIVEKDKYLSYAGCGLPYYVSGEVKEQKELMCTPVGVVRDPVFFQKVKNVHVLTETEAIKIDRKEKRVLIKTLADKQEKWLDYDKLVLATGAEPVVPPFPGKDLENIFTLHGVNDAEGVKTLLADEHAKDVVIVGGGLIGVEVTEALVHKGCRVTIVEKMPQIFGMLDWEMAALVAQHMGTHGVKILTNTEVKSFAGKGKVMEVVTDQGIIPTDMVIIAIGVRPQVQLALAAKLEIGETKAIKVNTKMQTSDPDIYAAGDCVEGIDRVTGKPCYMPMGSTANKHGRVAANNICGHEDEFLGVLGSTVCKVFGYTVGRTGLTEAMAIKAGYDVEIILAPAPDKAHFMSNAKPLLLKLVVDKKNRQLLGAQATGPGDVDKRIDVAAMALVNKMTVDQLANMDLCYAPPYSPAMDNIITAANVARNKLDGYMVGVTAKEVHEMLGQQKDFVLLDVRSPAEYEEVRLPNSTLIPLGALRTRLGELPNDKEIIAFCKISLRGYEAALILKNAGFKKIRVMDGGVVMWPYEKEK
jgi:NADPH-dependent 2,4-dienoyl-CoA reductase/sulfur reductase-like enzyme/rhodanese-related sulfurtransferase